jgi:hypothetical protein
MSILHSAVAPAYVAMNIGGWVPAQGRDDELRRREHDDQPGRFHNLTSGPSAPSTGSVFGNFTAGIVFNAFW